MIAPRRLRLHNEVAKALEQHYAGRLEEHAAELAEHFSHSSTEEDLRKAVRVRRAGGAARRWRSTPTARRRGCWSRRSKCRRCLTRTTARSARAPGELGTVAALGRRTGTRSKRWPQERSSSPNRLGGGARAARVAETAAWAIIYQHGSLAFVQPDYPTWAERIDAHAAPNSRERIVADCLMSWIHWFSKDQERCWELRRGALDMAQRLGDDEALALAVFTFIFDGGPQKWDQERLQVARKFRDIPRVGLPPHLTAQFLYSLVNNLVSGGDLASAEQYRLELERYAQRVDEPYVYMWQRFTEAQYLLTIGEIREELDCGAGACCWRGRQRHCGLRATPEQLRCADVRLSTWGGSRKCNRSRRCGRHSRMARRSPPGPTPLPGWREEARREMRRIMSEQQVGEGDWVPIAHSAPP